MHSQIRSGKRNVDRESLGYEDASNMEAVSVSHKIMKEMAITENRGDDVFTVVSEDQNVDATNT